MDPKHTNLLARESSPYLLQHAHNPVDWFPWGDEAFDKAKKENKLVLVSIGYSACHWCHVMEHESFEDETVARSMNENFVCIKVDREERPDVDQVYMTAVQLMTGSGGWPLNCFTLPDGRPIYGGTYFPQQNWMNVLHTLSDLFKKEPERVFQYASELTTAVKRSEIISASSEKLVAESILKECVVNWEKRFDNEEGGPKKAPKFPLPNNYQFLLRHYYFTKDPALLRHIRLTLEKMAFGGIYDQVGGGFARYSTDGEWKVPHFEKMLYDNAQMISLYSEAYQLLKDPLYKQTVYDTLEFIRREMTSPEGGFYSALDADSEGVEGKYYIWTEKELKDILGGNFPVFSEYYNVNNIGLWEEDHYILLRKKSDQAVANQFTITEEELQGRVSECKRKLLQVREKRIRPGLDNKILTSWNAMMIKGYADAYVAFNERKFLDAALKAADYILRNLSREDGALNHCAPLSSFRRGAGGEVSGEVNGFLEDYAFSIEAFISLYQATFDEQWLGKAASLAEYTLKHFRDPSSGMFYFTSNLNPELIARKMELQDNVIPSSNSSLARSLFSLGHYLGDSKYIDISEKMLKQVLEEMPKYGSAYSNWAILAQNFVYPFHEIAIVGNSVDEKKKELSEHFIPNAIFAGTPPPSPVLGEGGRGVRFPLLQGRFVEGKTLIYICVNNTCKLPVENTEEALGQLKN